MECKLDNITIHYEVHGDGKPILLLHGASLDHRHMISDFEPVFQERSGWQRICVDLPGHGKTVAPPWLVNHQQLLDVLLAFINHVIGEQRFLLIGTSWGGYLAHALIYAKGNQVDGLLLNVAPILLDREQRTLPASVTLVENLALLAESDQIDPRAGEAMRSQVVQIRPVLDWWLQNSGPAKDLWNEAFLDTLYEPGNREFAFSPQPVPTPFPAPTLILVGKQDTVVGWRDQWTLLDSYPRATFAALDRAGHLLCVHQPALFYALVSEWLDRVEEYVYP